LSLQFARQHQHALMRMKELGRSPRPTESIEPDGLLHSDI
jgi:hypothetical protein